MDFIYIDMKDGTGGFMIPDDGESDGIVEELLKDEKYVLRHKGMTTPDKTEAIK